MPKWELGDLRRSQVITSYGPGAIVDFRSGGAGVSVVSAGLEAWDRFAPPGGLAHDQTVFEPRLQKQLGVDGFRLPPVAPQIAPGKTSPHAGSLVGVRFPTWLQCPECHRLRSSQGWTEEPGEAALYCAPCSQDAGGRNRVFVVPVRFVVACRSGHLDEFPWNWWVRHEKDCTRSGKLKLEGSATAGLAGLILSCEKCNASRSMEGCFSEGALPGNCFGKRPWLGSDADEQCSERQVVVQRGASNIYFSVVASALDIPPWSDALQKQLGRHWAALERQADPDKRRLVIEALQLPDITGRPLDELASEVTERLARLQEPDRNLRWEEYQQLTHHKQRFGENTEFEIRPMQVPPELADWLDAAVQATRLREVRSLRGFTRITPLAGGNSDQVAALSARPKRWLPAIENRGEGIFIQLSTNRVRQWEAQDNVQERMSILRRSYHGSSRRGSEGAEPPELQPRYVLVHSLAHALIRQLALASGYNSASIRERLYVDDGTWEMAGILLFTSSPDADGTLGGLSRQGRPDYLVEMLESGLVAMSWCSSDPLCISGAHSMTALANGAACHACLLAAETSCEAFNHFLDRAFLVGTPDDSSLGFFSDLLS